ncbi:MAG: type I restriction endonuclease [Megasphaera cerevisiae]|jgi:hypothetical protein|nr:type I restriction endonuclease [Megasphaera cerevisiae]
MTFEEKITSFKGRIEKLKNNIMTEEATKTSLIMPFFQAMGYDIFNPNEFVPEFTADVGIKKGEKVDYAILVNSTPVILVECKSINEKLDRHDSQLFRYFGTTTAKFAILTNGILYRFYTDIEEANKMDTAPFLEIDLSNVKDYQIQELQKFAKENFNQDEIFDSAAELKYMNQIRQIIKDEIASPSDDLVRLILNRGIYDGVKTQNIVEKYQPLVKRSIGLVITEIINERLKNALAKNENNEDNEKSDSSSTGSEDNLETMEDKIITTQEELDSYYIIKSILRTKIEPVRITYTDKETYFAVNLDNKTNKWICRIYIRERSKYLTIKSNESVNRYDFKDIDEIYSLSNELQARLGELLTK